MQTENPREIPGQEHLLEPLHERPPLFEGVARVFTASTNPRKVAALNGWFRDLGIVNGCIELAAQPMAVVGEEPTWHSAVAVSRHKVECLVEALKRKPGGPTACFGNDVVFWLQETPLLNLSRIPDISGDHLQAEVSELQRIFQEPVVARWDNALSVSVRKRDRSVTRATVADVVRVWYDPIDPTTVAEIFWGDIPGALGRNTRLPLIDDPRLQQYIRQIQVLPIQALVYEHTGDLREEVNVDDIRGWTWMAGESGFETIRDVVSRSITGGLPRRKRLDELVNLHGQRSRQHVWKLI